MRTRRSILCLRDLVVSGRWCEWRHRVVTGRTQADGSARGDAPPASSRGARRAQNRPRGRSPRTRAGTGRSRRNTAKSAACRRVSARQQNASDEARPLATSVPDHRRGRRSRRRRYSASRALRLASSSSRFGTTTMSKPGAILLRRKTSRISRLARFLSTAPPTFASPRCQPAHAETVGQEEQGAETAMELDAPLVDLLELGAAADVFVRPETGRGIHSGHDRECSSRALLAADRQALAALGAAALEHQPAVLRAHPHEKPVGPCATTRVRLERALALHGLSDALAVETNRQC